MRAHLLSIMLCLVGGACPALSGCAPSQGADAPDLADPSGPTPDEPAFNELAGLVRAVAVQRPYGNWNEVSARFYRGGEPRFHTEAKRAGNCRLLSFRVALCNDFCNGVCVDTDVCRPFPSRSSAGPVSVRGISRPTTLSPGDGNYYTLMDIIPGELFTTGAAVTAEASGADFPGFRLSTASVVPFQSDAIVSDEITLKNETDFTFTWTPSPDPAARVRLTLNSTNKGHGLPYEGIIECDVPDRAGSLTIKKELIAAFPATQRWDGCVRIDCPMSSVLRYRTAASTTEAGRIELRAGSEKMLWVLHSAK